MKANKQSIAKKGNKLILLIFILLIISMLATLIGSVSFTNNPVITPLTDKRPDTNDTLTCLWNVSADTTQQNVTWYKDGVSFKNETDLATSESTISSDNTTRGEVWNCTVTITNGTEAATYNINVTIKNAVPTTPTMTNSTGSNIGNVTNVTEDMANIFNVSSTDPDGDTITYGYIGSIPSNSSFATDTGVFSWTPNYNQNSTNITFYATDNYGDNPGITSKKVLFTVVYVNDAPYFYPALENQSINESQVFNYYIYGLDEENNTQFNFSLSYDSGISLTVNSTSNTSAVIMFAGNATANYSQAGNYTINVTIIDSLGANSTSSFRLRINQTDLAPELVLIPNYSGTQGSQFNFSVYANDADVNDTLTFAITLSASCVVSNPWSITTVNNSYNATGLVNVSALTNDHVLCRYISINVTDGDGAWDSQDVFLNISNTNDPPNVEVLSSSSSNTGGNNISNLTAYAESPFVYFVNATDADANTYEGEVLSYSDNSTFFDIDASTGEISFTPNQSIAANHTINITVSDDGSPGSGTRLNSSILMILQIRNNSAPVLQAIGSLSCAEDNLCFMSISATDSDNDELNFTSNSTSVFNLTNNQSQSPVISAYVNYTPTQSRVGNYTMVVAVRDSRGAADNETITFAINNTNDAPAFQDFSFPSTIVENHNVILYVFANDDDYNFTNSYEYVTFNDTNVTGKDFFNITTHLNSSNNKTYGIINFTPGDTDEGNYTVNISIRDYYNATISVLKNFTVLNQTNAPNISQVTPYGRPYSDETVFNFTYRSNYEQNSTEINFSENRSVTYNITASDDTTASADLNYTWYVNGSVNKTGSQSYLSIDYSFFSSGYYNITVTVTDDTYESSSWAWNVTVDNVNRAPLLITALPNITVSANTNYSQYLKETTGVHFIDPDDDLDSDNDFDDDESSTLTYTVTACSVATITIYYPSVYIEPEEVGTCTVYFTAEDAEGLNKTSDVVYVNVTAVPNATSETPVSQPTSGGGGGSSRSVVVPITTQEEKPRAIEIIVPQLVTIYANQTILIPVIIKNNWNTSLKEIRLNASSNASFVKLAFTDNYFDELAVGEQRETTLMIGNYRLGDNYEVKMTANVTDPKTSDSALVLLNSIQQAEEGLDVQTKVTFAQDLLNENPECLELNELLEKAKSALSTGSTADASKMVDGVINGCKYLVSIAKRSEQKPESIVNKVIREENIKYLLAFMGVAVLTTLGVFMVKRRKAHIAKAEEEEKKKEAAEKEEVKPYWP